MTPAHRSAVVIFLFWLTIITHRSSKTLLFLKNFALTP